MPKQDLCNVRLSSPVYIYSQQTTKGTTQLKIRGVFSALRAVTNPARRDRQVTSELSLYTVFRPVSHSRACLTLSSMSNSGSYSSKASALFLYVLAVVKKPEVLLRQAFNSLCRQVVWGSYARQPLERTESFTQLQL